MISKGQDEEIVVQIQGQLDQRGGQWLQQQLETITPKRYTRWIVDLSQIDFVDSSGLAALVSGLKLATQAGARLVLCGLRPSVQLIFEITQLDRAFTIFEDQPALLSTSEPPSPAGIACLEAA